MKIAIVGATGLVGRNIIQLCEDNFSSDVEYWNPLRQDN